MGRDGEAVLKAVEAAAAPAGSFGHKSRGMAPIARKGLHLNQLMSPDPGDINPVSGGFAGTPRIKIRKA